MNASKTLGMLFAILSLAGCSDDDGLEGNGQLQSETRTEEQFVRVENRASYDVEVRTGQEFGVRIQIDGNLLPLVQTQVENGTLVLSETEPMELEDPHVIVTLPVLEQVIVTGRGDVDVAPYEHTNPVRLTLTGEGDIEFYGSAPDIIVEDNGPGEIEVHRGGPRR